MSEKGAAADDEKNNDGEHIPQEGVVEPVLEEAKNVDEAAPKEGAAISSSMESAISEEVYGTSIGEAGAEVASSTDENASREGYPGISSNDVALSGVTLTEDPTHDQHAPSQAASLPETSEVVADKTVERTLESKHVKREEHIENANEMEDRDEEIDAALGSGNKEFADKRRTTNIVYARDPFDPEDYRYKILEPSKCVGVFGFGTRKEGPGDVYQVMKKFGPVESVDFIKDPKSGKFRGYGFVYFKNLADAKKAVEEANMKGLVAGNIRIRLDFSKSNPTGVPRTRHLPPNVVRLDKRDLEEEHTRNKRHRSRDSDRRRGDRYDDRNSGRSAAPPSIVPLLASKPQPKQPPRNPYFQVPSSSHPYFQPPPITPSAPPNLYAPPSQSYYSPQQPSYDPRESQAGSGSQDWGSRQSLSYAQPPSAQFAATSYPQSTQAQNWGPRPPQAPNQGTAFGAAEWANYTAQQQNLSQLAQPSFVPQSSNAAPSWPQPTYQPPQMQTVPRPDLLYGQYSVQTSTAYPAQPMAQPPGYASSASSYPHPATQTAAVPQPYNAPSGLQAYAQQQPTQPPYGYGQQPQNSSYQVQPQQPQQQANRSIGHPPLRYGM